MNSIYPVILANTKFSIDLLQERCLKDETSNVLFSPLSISSALGLVVLGARGETKDQIMTTLYFGQIKIMYHDLYEAINKSSYCYKLMLANRLYGEISCDFKDDGIKTVPMMCQTDKFPLATIDEADCRILELFYEHKELSMFILLPNRMDLKKIESLITYEKLQEWTQEDKFLITEIKISLPKMEMEITYKLSASLKCLGIFDSFLDHCDFSDMTSNPLKLSDVVNKSGIFMNEISTEAQAGTGPTTTLQNSEKFGSTDGNQVSFVADHPFLFFIRHNDTKSILFWGRYCSP
ncbi:Leukocyte elastase inhibitor [Triplophysa tibetana]|uniref:Serpin B6 n=1 Tax=Triplophysa tibetana TaxID=1572043 RepID=A0A5A9PEL9_9TELE|nr:Leukocyte elastase inhibitor [Triplophysa tibetana]